ncbi:hypothetical protein O181_007760 [Austropuccinia psidii MF-1]|uniref:Reverse transcriptase Ty1/copia-type domain-containing protein n=1 Tax=Austropuccinia psidii MF-1 TaxID=1389203 RepID=A0A9Q3BNL9_9BASI|nr:hypothetical protein [Austropuccinia psidii MF-1]
MWKAKLTTTLRSLGLVSAQSNKTLFTNNDRSLLLHVHVDDGFIISKSENTIITFLNSLNTILQFKYKRRPTQHPGHNLEWSNNDLKINQTNLTVKLLEQFEIQDRKPVKTPCNGNFLNEIKSNLLDKAVQVTSFHKAIGSINYLSPHTRPDMMFAINQLSKYPTKPNKCHWNALKHLLCYMNGTKEKCLAYKQQSIKETLTSWANTDYVNNKEDRKSISGYVILAFRNPIYWLSKKQLVVAQSTTEDEYIAMNICSKQL